MMVYLVCAHFSTWQRTKTGECQAGGDPSQITQKCAFLSPWVSPVVVPLRQTDTNRLNRETREWRHWVNQGVWCFKRPIITRPNKLNLNPEWNYRLRGIFQSCEVMDMHELPKQKATVSMRINPPKDVWRWSICIGPLPATSVQLPPGLYPPHTHTRHTLWRFSQLWVDIGKLWRLQDTEVTHRSGSLYHLCR